MASDPNNNSIFWSGGHNTFAMAVSKTTDQGSNWTRYYIESVGFTFAIAVDPATSDIVYAGGNPGLYKTTNGGTDWFSASSGINGYVYAIAINPSITTTLYVGTPESVFKSTNSGTTWSDIGLAGVNAIVIDPNDTEIIYVGTNTGVYKSSTGGGNWTSMNQGLEDSTVTSLGIDSDNYLFAGTTRSGMYRWRLLGVAEQESCKNRTLAFYALPNPATHRARIYYDLSSETMVNLSIYDVQGRLVKELVNDTKKPGLHTAFWNGLDKNGIPASAGIYFYNLSIYEGNYIKKLILVR